MRLWQALSAIERVFCTEDTPGTTIAITRMTHNPTLFTIEQFDPGAYRKQVDDVREDNRRLRTRILELEKWKDEREKLELARLAAPRSKR